MTHVSSPSVVRPTDPDGGLDLLPVASLLLRRAHVIVWCVFVFLGLGITHALLAPVRYTATTRFIVAQSPTLPSLGGLSALASRFGQALPPSIAGDYTPRLLLAALTSREVLDAVLDTALVVDDRSETIRLLSWYDVRGDSRPERLENGRKLLNKRMNTALDDRTGILTLSVEDGDPDVAAAIARALVAVLNDFNLRTQQTTSKATRVFLEHRVGDVVAELGQAEEDLRTFLQQNRQVSGSPQLQLVQARLQRRIDLRQQVYMELSQALEQARTNEVKDTPVLTIIEHAVPPVKRSWPRRKLIVIGWLVAGLAAALVWIAVSSWLAQTAAADRPSWREFRSEFNRLRRRLPGHDRLP